MVRETTRPDSGARRGSHDGRGGPDRGGGLQHDRERAVVPESLVEFTKNQKTLDPRPAPDPTEKRTSFSPQPISDEPNGERSSEPATAKKAQAIMGNKFGPGLTRPRPKRT